MCFLGLLFQTQVQGGRLFCSTRVSGKTGAWKELDEAGRMWSGELLAWGAGAGEAGRKRAPVWPLLELGLEMLSSVRESEEGGCLKRRVD